MLTRIGLFGLATMTLMACNKPSDYDQDGYFSDEDCNDNNADIHPGALEICDGIDNNCDDSIDGEDADGALTYYADLDGDTYGGEGLSITQCDMPEGYVDNADDCDDNSADIHPDGSEVCDGVDNDWTRSSTTTTTRSIQRAFDLPQRRRRRRIRQGRLDHGRLRRAIWIRRQRG